MRRLVVAFLALGALVAPTQALAGGWATVGMDPPQPPSGSGPGDQWTTQITVWQHGVTPLVGVKPVLILTDRKSGEELTFPGKPTDERGVYAVSVELPAKGTYEVSVYDGFTQYGGAQTHTFAPISVGTGGAPAAAAERPKAAPAPAADPSIAVWPFALAALAAALLGAALFFARRARRKAPVTA